MSNLIILLKKSEDAQTKPFPHDLNNSFLTLFFEALQSLFLFGSLGLVSLGIYLNHKIGLETSFYPFLWMAGSLYVYNLDRLIPDAADKINLPNRTTLRPFRLPVMVVSLLLLVALPTAHRAWLVLLLIILAILVSSFYSLRPPGFSSRLKDVWFLKWLIPPLVIMVSLTAPIWIDGKNLSKLSDHCPLCLTLLLALMTNILLFDQRDRDGDISVGLKTVATYLSRRQFHLLLLIMILLQALLLLLDPQPEMLFLAAYLGILVVLSQNSVVSGFYHWAVDGMLFIPFTIQLVVKFLN